MIFKWLWLALRFVLRLIVPPPKASSLPIVDPAKIRCRACGHVGLTMKYEVVTTRPGKGDAIRAGLLRLTCPACSAFFRVKPLYSIEQEGGRPVGADEVGGTEIQGLTT